jgi:L-lysine exporter family protein LysE/ArgO
MPRQASVGALAQTMSQSGLSPAHAPTFWHSSPSADIPFHPMSTALSASVTQGFALSLSLIVAIGAQNAFVLRQGLRREHVGPLVLACAGSDALLMAIGVAGLARLTSDRPWLTQALAAAGVVFLTLYGLRALWRAAQRQQLSVAEGAALSLRAAMLQLAGFTLLNPHVYLDTVMLVGAVGAQQGSAAAQAAFVGGAAAASLIWFAALGYGARWLAPLFRQPRAWQALDLLIGVGMLWMAWLLWPMVRGAAVAGV